MSQPSEERSLPKKARPIVPFLRLADDGEAAHLVGKQCVQCGAVYLGARVACSKCTSSGPFREIRLSATGTLWVYSIVHQSAPGIPTPYVAAIVDLPEGVSVRCNIIDIEPTPEKIRFGMPVQMVTKKVREDKEGNELIAFFFRPAQ
jgi:uncharacterized OB-fold protein